MINVQVVNQQCYFLQNTTYPSCGDCVFSDFRGDAGATGPQVHKINIGYIYLVII